MSKKLTVRMYNVGFGDCFLLMLPDKRTILVDAGFHSQGKGEFGGNDLVDQILKDVKDFKGEARLDVVIATHRHQDHVYAFNSDTWGEFEVGEVWLPWVEDRANKEATRLWKKQQQFAKNLALAMTHGLKASDKESVDFMLWNAGIDPAGFDAGGWSNAGALDCLHEGFKRRDRARPRFLPETKAFPETFESSMLPDVRVHVLGPPRDPDLIAELDPEDDGETYRALALAAAGPMADGISAVAAPFGATWQVPDTEGVERPFEKDDVDRINYLARTSDAVFAAEKVDGMINSTSLVLVLEIGKARLLLPGDAEWGTWRRILGDDDARALLRGATFYKVGHHGSHNATSKTLVEKVLARGIPAMISTQKGPGKYRNNIPLTELLDALKARDIHYARSDEKDVDLPQGFNRGDGVKWIDLELPC
jgi:beta-lactamase superfamily II metal-dependent hydrolase